MAEKELNRVAGDQLVLAYYIVAELCDSATFGCVVCWNIGPEGLGV